jgi:hypothetical protein
VFSIPIGGHDFSGEVYYEFIVTVTDSTGLKTSASALIYPEKVMLSFDSVPSGLTINVDGIPRTTPFTLDSAVAFNYVVDAPDQLLGLTPYSFTSWSDGGARQHTLVVPTSPQSYVATFTAGAAPPIPGLSARYAFEEATGITTADVSGNNNYGVLSVGVSWTAGKFGAGVSFNGTSGDVVVNDSATLDLSGSYTLTAWIKPDTLAGFQTILIKEVSASCGYWLQTVGAQISSGFNSGSGCIDHQTSTANLLVGSWYHVAAVLDRDAQTFKIYVNGVEHLSEFEPGGPVPNSESLVFGRTHAGERWDGVLDDVRIYNRALTTSEIQQVLSGTP